MKEQVFTRNENGELVILNEIDSPDEPLKPDWTKLEQDLRYYNNGSLFGKALTTAAPNPFSIFLKTLENGSKGIASQNALAYAFSILGVSWTWDEKNQLNILLSNNNFTFQI